MLQPTKNTTLLAVPAEERTRILDQCERVSLRLGTTLDRVGEPTSAVHFPETAVISTLATYRDGTTIEMANVGREACTGLNLILGHPRQLNTNEVQVEGDALRMTAEDFVSLKAASPEFANSLMATVQAVFYQVMISGGCNGAHDAKQRLARWLLTMWDRSDGGPMHLTQEFLAQILGVRRATVTEAAIELREAGAIDYARGSIEITDAAALHRESCECYDLVRSAYAELLQTPGKV